MYQSDIKIIELIEMLKTLGKINYDKDFCDAIGILKQNIAPIKKGKAHFTAKHIENICKIYDVNANWIFGANQNAFNKTNAQSAQKLHK